MTKCFLIIATIFIFGCSTKRSEDIELTFWAMGAEGEYVVSLIDEFEKENPKIKVTVQ